MKSIIFTGFVILSMFLAEKVKGQTVYISNFSPCDITYQLSDGTDSYIVAGSPGYSFTPTSVPVWGRFNNGCDLEFLTVGNPPLPSTLTATNLFPCSCNYTVNWNFIPPGTISITIF